MQETKFSLKISYPTHVFLAQLDRHQTSKPVMVCCEFNSHWGQLYFLRHFDANFVQKCQKCQICVIYENLTCNLRIPLGVTILIIVRSIDMCHKRTQEFMLYLRTLGLISIPIHTKEKEWEITCFPEYQSLP